jgi:hypothetical protein
VTDRHVAWGARGLAVAALALLAPQARAQWSVGADVQSATRYMWRGITRSQVWVAQPALSVTSPEVCLESHSLCGNVSAGAWANEQMQGAWPDELGDLAVRKRGFSEVDLWAEGAVRSEGLEFAAGGVRYLYPASDPGALWTHADNTTEMYARVRLPRFPWVKPSVVAWLDVDHVKGAYVEASVIGGLKLVPMVVETNLDLGATAGVNLGQERSLALAQLIKSKRLGLTYLELVLGPSGRAGPWRLALDLHSQWGFDDLTRLASRTGDASRRFFMWFTASVGYTCSPRP